MTSNKSCRDKYKALIQLGFYTNVADQENGLKKCGIDPEMFVNLDEFDVKKSKGDGNCLYTSIVKSAQDNGIQLKGINSGHELRKYLIANIDKCDAMNTAFFKSSPYLKVEAKTSLELGVTKDGEPNKKRTNESTSGEEI